MYSFARKWAAALSAFVILLLSASPAIAVTGLPVPAVFGPSDMVLNLTIPTAGAVVEMPINGTVSNVTIDWGDGVTTGPVSAAGNQAHTYASAGNFTIVISGSMTWFGSDYGYQGASHITEVVQWGTLGLTSLRMAFFTANHLTALPNYLPAGITNLSDMFIYASIFNDDISGWDTSAVTDMHGMFANADAFNNGSATNDQAHPLRTVGSAWDVSKVTNMTSMFSDARMFNQDISNWDTSSVTTMNGLFWNCFLFNQPIGNWNTSNVTTMNGMFWANYAFNQDVSNFDTAKVTDMYGMFRGASAFNNGSLVNDEMHPLRAVGNKWKLTAVTRLEGMFMGAASFNQDISNWDTSTVWNMDGMFDSATRFNQNISHWNTTSLLTVAWMFRGASAFNNGNQAWSSAVGEWDFKNVSQAGFMFADATSFNQDVSSWDTRTLGNTACMFCGASAFNNGGAALRTNGTKWDTSHLVYAVGMFSGAAAFNADISNWVVTGLTEMNTMFTGAAAFNQDIGSWDVSNVTNMYAMFSGAAAFNKDLNSWNMSSVTNTESMFERATAFNGNITSWDLSSVQTMYAMFHYASSFNQDIGGWNVGRVTNMSHMFRYATSFNRDLSLWNTSSVWWLGQMFGYSGFDQDIGAWETAGVYDAGDMFVGGSLSTANYDKLLIGWSANTNRPGVVFGAGSTKYSADGAAARAKLVGNSAGDSGWYVSDGGLAVVEALITTPPAASSIVYGQSLAQSTLSGGVTNVPGAFAFTDSTVTPDAGSASHSVTFTPTNPAIAPVTTTVSVTVAQANQVLMWDAATSAATSGVYLDQFSIGATSTANLLPTYSVSGGCVLVGDVVTLTSSSQACIVTASQAGNSNVSAAASITHTITTAKAPMAAIVIGSPSTSLTFDPTTPATTYLQVSGGSGIGARTWTVPVGDPCTVTEVLGVHTVTATGAGTCHVTLSISSDDNFLAGSSNQLTFNIAKAMPTTSLSTNSASATLGKSFSSPTVITNSTGAKSYSSSNTAVATVDAATGEVTLVGVGSTTITLTLASTNNFDADSASYSLIVVAANQTLTWDQLTDAIQSKIYGDIFTIAAASTEDLAPTYAADGGCSVQGNVVTMTSGSVDCVIAATQSGSASVTPANPISKTIRSTKLAQPALTISASDSELVYNPLLPVTTEVIATGGAGTGEIVFSVRSGDDCTVANNGDKAKVTATAAGTCRVSAVRGGDVNHEAGARVSVDIITSKAAAVITLVNPPETTVFGQEVSPPKVDINSPNSLRFVSSNPQVVEVDAATGKLTVRGVGTATITVESSASANFSAPQAVSYELRVDPAVPAAPSNVRTSISGATMEVAWDAPTFTGGTPLEKFVVSAQSGDQTLSCEAVFPATSCVVEGINPGTSYSIEVQAVAAGVSAPLTATSEMVSADVPASPEPSPSPTEQVIIDERGLEVVNIVQDDPVAVAETTVKTVALVAAAAAASAAVAAAGAAGAAASSAAGASGASSNQSGSSAARPRGDSSSTSTSTNRASDDGSEDAGVLRDISEGKTEVDGISVDDYNWGDSLRIWSMSLLTFTDRPTHNVAVALAPKSPLLSKMILDGAYLRAMIGSLALVMPFSAVALGWFGFVNNAGVFLPPTAFVLGALVVIGAFDVMAALLGMGVFAIGMAVTAGISDAADARLLFGLFAAVLTPSLLATGFRAVRRTASSSAHDWWQRAVDFAVGPLLAATMAQTVVAFLPALGGASFPVARSANAIALAAAIAMVFRIVFEEVAAQTFPARLDTVHPAELHPPRLAQKLGALVLRAVFFFFIAEALVGPGWHLYVGTALFILPAVVGLFEHKLPNVPLLYQVLPSGLPGFAFSIALGTVALAILTSAVGESANLAQIGFAVLPIPSTVFSIIKMFGRAPAEGQIRWSHRPNLVWIHRTAGVAVLGLTAYLLGFI